MKGATLNIALTIWLAASVGIWLLGIAFAGRLFLPYPNPFTLLLVYGPWLALLVVMVSNWGRRHDVRVAKPAALSVAALIALTILLYPVRDVAKERYFNAVLSSCQDQYEVENVSWEDVPAFDGNVRRFRARSDADRHLITCVNRRAGFLMVDLICPGESPWADATNALEISFGTFHGIPAEHFFSVVHYDFGAANARPTATAEQCP